MNAISGPHAQTRPTAPIRLGVIGCGWIMRGIYAPILKRLEGQVKVTALCDISTEALTVVGQIFPKARAYAGVEQMLAEGNLDAVMVLTSEGVNARTAIAVLTANIPVYLEKPPARDREELHLLIAAVEKSSATLYAAYNRRHCPLLRELEIPKSLRRVSGRMERMGRTFRRFPYTALHLIDSLHYFTRTQALDIEASVQDGPPRGWRLSYRLDTGCPAELTFIPDGDTHCEILVLEGVEKSVEIHFPNPESDDAQGRLIIRNASGEVRVIPGIAGDPAVQMGYEPALQGFLDNLAASGTVPEAYRLDYAAPGISLMNAMFAAIPDAETVVKR
ncbi:Gfo/Idh/MocA family oxidoreductase [Ruficoccus amylovorans]|uniref:Gfo/Idh/MocA family oxidoreductase n=1 Tax=Ruficoccus amylovorans TaxID=1804625 RepID=A0A842HGT5_9BACT|nr:Gfo/Idh/MocA family oxidoreductase [Ruficoccus amylovorans]MBC2595925.1 Gfo/Idh/MocA family oxidoreductase [Ruficoccus amylovorans]